MSETLLEQGPVNGWEYILTLPQRQWAELVGVNPMLPVGVMVQVGHEGDGDRRLTVNKAYDTRRDTERFSELKNDVGEKKARELMLRELLDDLATHALELTGIDGENLAYSWRYLIDEEGQLVEDSEINTPVRTMFDGLTDTASALWQEYMVGGLEQMPVGTVATTLSSRRDEVGYEGVYDFLYIFQKIGPQLILAYGLGVKLTRLEQVQIHNAQVERTGNYWLLLDPDASSDEIRSRAFFYPPGWFKSPFEAYGQILNRADQFEEEQIQTLFSQAQRALDNKRSDLESLATEMVNQLAAGQSTRDLLNKEQIRQLWQAYPEKMAKWQDDGLPGIMLPCGWVDLGFDLFGTTGDSLVAMQMSGECVQKKCRRCGNTDISETDTKCRKCSWAPGDAF